VAVFQQLLPVWGLTAAVRDHLLDAQTAVWLFRLIGQQLWSDLAANFVGSRGSGQSGVAWVERRVQTLAVVTQPRVLCLLGLLSMQGPTGLFQH